MVKVSLIIPCYNGIKYIENLCKCLYESVPENTEIIFIDDGSTDGCASIFKKMYPGGIVIRKKNAGLAAARNTGAEIAQGEYLQFLDVDDLIEKNKITDQYYFAKSKELDVVYSDWQMVVVKESETIFEPIFNTPMADEPAIELLRGWWNPPHSYLIKRSAYFDVGSSDESLINAQDFDVFLRLAINNKKFGYLPGNYSKYYRFVNVKSLARKSKKQYWTDYEKAVFKCFNSLFEKGKIDEKYLDIISKRLFLICRNIYKIDKSWANRLLKKIKKIHPGFKGPDDRIYRFLFILFGFYLTEFGINIYNRLLNIKNKFQ
jgi:glycosyltransferase involved in cell wall biosynthesis